MILENSDKLRDWLGVVLEPLCDADSSALARYVIALLKKDKTDKDLKRIMIEQLDVFLSEETTRFVERLFDAIASEEYLTLPVPVGASASNVDTDEPVLHIDGAVEIENALEGHAPPKDNVIKPDGNHLSSSRSDSARGDAFTAASAASTMPQSNNSSSTSTSNNMINNNSSASNTSGANLTHTKPAFDHKAKDSYNGTIKPYENHSSLPGSSNPHHHHYSNNNERIAASTGGSTGGFVRSASPPLRSAISGSGMSGNSAHADKENQPRDSRRRRASLRSRSRSRSNERVFRRSRSRDRRINEREKSQRQFRNKSPPGAGEGRHHASSSGAAGRRNFDRRRLGGGSGMGGNSNNNDERQRFGNKTRRSHSPRSRSRSNSQERQSRRNTAISSPDRAPLPATNLAQMPEHLGPAIGEPQRQRCRDFDEKGYCVRGETCPWDHGVNPVVFEGINNSALMMSMREYNPDAPEIWARGGPPPPGAQPPPPPPPPQGPGSINPFSGNARPNTMMAALPGGSPMDYVRGPMMPFAFNPTAVTTPLQRQLIPIPVVDGSGCVGAPPGAGGAGGVADMGKRRFELEDTVAIADVPTKRKVPINSRLGPRVNANMQQHNCSLELRKVPRGLNTIAHLNNHFAKFGKIVNIQVSYEGDPEAAIITFSTHAEANVAYRSTEAVLNNRFIKVFWHNDSNADANSNMSNLATAGNSIIAGAGRKNTSQYHLHNVPALPTPNADSAKISNAKQQLTTSAVAGSTTLGESETGVTSNSATTTTAVGTAATPAASTAAPASMRLKLNTGASSGAGVATGRAPGANAAIIRKKQEEQQKAVHQLANGLRKRKQELLHSYVKQMKTALELLERCDSNDPQRANALNTVKDLEEKIEKLRKEVFAEQAQVQQQQPPVKKTKEQQKKELLDIELELFAQQQEGNDTTAIQKRLEELQRTMNAANSSHPLSGGKMSHFNAVSGAPGGPRKRATFPEGPTRVDRRPKAIVVTGFASEEIDLVLNHFRNFGEVSKHDVDREIPQLILSYKTRPNAEQAVLRGKLYKDKRLQISWAPVVLPTTQVMPAPGDKLDISTSLGTADKLENPKLLMQSVSESESLIGSDTLPELRLEDEEEDDESEERSWRR